MKRYYWLFSVTLCFATIFTSLSVLAYETKYYRDENYNLRAWYYNRIESQDGSGDQVMIMCPRYSDAGFVDKHILEDRYTNVKDAYVGDLIVPEKINDLPVVALDKAAFYMSTNITSIALHDGIDYIGEGAFYGCSKLTRINIPEGVTSIEGGTFWACVSIAQIELPTTIKAIGNKAFCGCSKLHNVIVPANVLSIGEYAFYPSGVHEIEFKGTLPVLGNHALEGVSRLFYRGVAPSDAGCITNAVSKTCVLYVDPNNGWGVSNVPGVWNGYTTMDIRVYDGETNVKYPVKFDATGGSCSESAREVKYNSPIGDLPVPVRAGFFFLGWSMQNGGPLITESTIITKPVTLYARWEGSYMIVDLSAGSNANVYPVTAESYVSLLSSENRTNRLLLRRIAPGSFVSGSPSTEKGHQNNEEQCQVTIEEAYYIGVAEVTQRQWELVCGTRPSYFSNNSYYADRPVERITYEMARGSSWRESDNPSDDSFLGKLNLRTGLHFDLPTEAQWEYACRAGTTTAFNNGTDSIVGLGRYGCTHDGLLDGLCGTDAGTARVGSYRANAWGLYDMHGNVFELTLTDMLRGGAWGFTAETCRSAARRGGYWASDLPEEFKAYYGLRVMCRIAAKIAGQECTITFNANGGTTTTTSSNFERGTTVESLPEATRDGYDFLGWFTASSGGVQITVGTTVLENATWYAHWTEHKITPTSCMVWFVANGGSVSPETRQCDSGSCIGILPVPTREGYVFDGWYTASSEKVSESMVITADTTFYARWSKNDSEDPPSVPTYTVTFDAHGGCFVDGEEPLDVRKCQYVEGTSIGDPPEVAQKGCLLIGWSYSKGFDYETSWSVPDYTYITTKTKVSKDLKVYAQWREISYYVQYNANGGSCSTEGQWVRKDSTVGELPIAQRTGYKFLGWLWGNDFLCATNIVTEAIWCDAQWEKLPIASYGPFVPGEEVSLSMPEYIGYSAKGLPSGLKFDKVKGVVSGVPTKPTDESGAITTFTKKNAESLEVLFVVSAIPTIDVVLEGDTEKCKVTGANKAYLVGKKVSLSVSSPKGTAFTGWYRDGKPWPSETDYLKTKLSYVMAKESLSITARFEKEKMSLACTELANAKFTTGVSLDAAGLPVEIQTQSGVKSVKATKLPTGMKLVQDKSTKTWSISGAPTKAGTYNVTLTVTAVSGATQSITIPVTVAALPSCLVGTYTGMVGRGEGENWRAYGTFSLTVAATGKLSSKVVVPGGSYSFSAARWDRCVNDAFVVEMKTKKGETLSLIVDGAKPWYEAKISDAEQGNVFSIPKIEPFQVVAWRNEFGKNGELVKDAVANDFVSKIIALKKIALRVTGSKSEGYDLAVLDSNDRTADLKITFDAKGNVKFAGKIDGTSISGKSLLRVDGSDYYTLFDLVLPIKKSAVMYFAFGFERGETDAPECDFEVRRYDYP